MTPPCFQGSTAMAGMIRYAWTKANPCPDYVAIWEWQCICAAGQRDAWSLRALADRWCRNWRVARRIVRDVQVQEPNDVVIARAVREVAAKAVAAGAIVPSQAGPDGKGTALEDTDGVPVAPPATIERAVLACAPLDPATTPPGPVADVQEWVPRTVPASTTRVDVQALVLRAVEEITQRSVAPARCASHAKEILSLWRSLGCPEPCELAEEIALVARAARESAARLFARDVRAEGWPGGVDRRHSVATLCVHRRWDERLAVAREWAAAGYPIVTTGASTDGFDLVLGDAVDDVLDADWTTGGS